MKNSKKFIEELRLAKAKMAQRAPLIYGEKVNMFGNSYKVCKCDENGYTILEDDKNYKFAIPTQKLAKLLKKGLAHNAGAVNFVKSFKDGLKKAQQAKLEGFKGAPVGTVSQGAGGEVYKKVSMQPAKWVHLRHGTTHDHPEAESGGHFEHGADQQAYIKLRSKFKLNTDPKDHPEIEKKLDEWVKQKYKIKNLKDAYNSPELDEKGNKISAKKNLTQAQFRRMGLEQEKADLMHKRLLELVKESYKRRLKMGA